MKINGPREEIRMADRILNLLEKSLTGSATIEAYDNGREQGYVLKDDLSEAVATFAENRNSDDAVVYLCDWNSGDDKAIDLSYKARKLFRTPELAAEFITRVINASRD